MRLKAYGPEPFRRRRSAYALACAGMLLALVAGYLFLKPVGIKTPDGSAVRPMTWTQAIAAVAAIQARESADAAIKPDCHTRLVGHGARTANVVVLLHGYTNCPKQDDALAAQLAGLGYTVYIPLAPHHGQIPERRDPLGSLTADELAAYGDETMDIAGGLGEEVSILGLSGGGLVASYIAQYRADADLVIPVAAYLGLPSVPAPFTSALVNALELLPPIDANDPAADEAVRGAFPHGASDTSVQGAAAYMEVGQTLIQSAAQVAPLARRIVVLVNDADTTVSNAMIEDLFEHWHAAAPDRTEIRHLGTSLGVLHDMITPDRAGQKIDVVYPILLGLLR